MLETEKLDGLFSLLEETQSKISYPKLAPPLNMQRFEKYSIGGFLFTALVFLVLVAWQRLGTMPPPGFYAALLIIYLILQVLALVYGATLAAIRLVAPQTAFFRYVDRPEKRSASRREILITQLWTFDKATLAYGLLQYRHRWLSFEGRVSGFAGNLRKLGLFPAWAAISISVATVLKEDSNPLLWVPPTVAAIFSLVALGVLVSLERPQQVIHNCWSTPFSMWINATLPHSMPITNKKARPEDELSKYGNPQKTPPTCLVPLCSGVEYLPIVRVSTDSMWLEDCLLLQ